MFKNLPIVEIDGVFQNIGHMKIADVVSAVTSL